MGRNSLDQLSLFNLEDYEKKYDSSIETYTCRKCKKAKPITRENFEIRTILRNDTGILSTMCLSCQKDYNAERRERIKYNTLPYPSDDYKCPICTRTLEEINNLTVVVDRDTYKPASRKFEKRWVLDHDHDTGKVRGWICSPCNVTLGAFGDNTINLKRAIKYLEESENNNE
jgi:hypothetical protein